jgi:hypothetical protein
VLDATADGVGGGIGRCGRSGADDAAGQGGKGGSAVGPWRTRYAQSVKGKREPGWGVWSALPRDGKEGGPVEDRSA